MELLLADGLVPGDEQGAQGRILASCWASCGFQGGCLGFTQQCLSLGLEKKGEHTSMALILEFYISLHAGLLAMLCKARPPSARCPTEGGADSGRPPGLWGS